MCMGSHPRTNSYSTNTILWGSIIFRKFVNFRDEWYLSGSWSWHFKQFVEKLYANLDQLIYFAFPAQKDSWIGKGIEGSPSPFNFLPFINIFHQLFLAGQESQDSDPFHRNWEPVVSRGRRLISKSLLKILRTFRFWCTPHILPEIPKSRISYLFFNIHQRLYSMKKRDQIKRSWENENICFFPVVFLPGCRILPRS